VLVLCDCPAELTGQVCVSLDLLEQRGVDVHGLDGRPLAGEAAR
jgi:hypothetical protein